MGEGSQADRNDGMLRDGNAGRQRFTVLLQRLQYHLGYLLDVSQSLFPRISPGRRALRLQLGDTGAPNVRIRFQYDAQDE